MTEPQNVSGLMDQIHDLKRQLADSENRRAMLQRQCQDARLALTAAGIGKGETLADGISELRSRLADARSSAEDARRRGAATALRMTAADWRGDHVASAAAVADDLTKFATALESGEVTL